MKTHTSHQLENEPPQVFSRMIPFDGNNSMKRIGRLGNSYARDPLPFVDTDYLLPPEYVDQFADEVPSRRGPQVPGSIDAVDDELWEDMNEDDDEALVAGCTQNWKAAASDEKKRMWDIFEETGFFVSACRHSLILWFSDMIRSGEL